MAKNKATNAAEEIDILADSVVEECRDYLSADEPDIEALHCVVSRVLRNALPAMWEWSSQESEIERLQAIIGKLVPQTYGEAVLIYPWLPCQPHEWDNRTTEENAAYLIEAIRIVEMATIRQHDR